MNAKVEHLKAVLRDMESALVAYSGGLDSLFLLRIAHEVLGNRVIALTALSPSYPSYEWEAACEATREMGVRHERVETFELKREGYAANRGDRCYFCKTELYEICRDKARVWGMKEILNGTHCDDLGDYRPGLRAAEEQGIRSPLREAGFTKADLRACAREIGMKQWDKPALACLSSRFPPGTEVTEERLRRIDRIESALIRMGAGRCRVRFHEPIARIEVDDLGFLVKDEIREAIVSLCRREGFLYATLDLAGYQQGGGALIPMTEGKGGPGLSGSVSHPDNRSGGNF